MTNGPFFHADLTGSGEGVFENTEIFTATEDVLCKGKECSSTLVNSPPALQSAEIIGFAHEGVRHGHAVIFMQHHNYGSINTKVCVCGMCVCGGRLGRNLAKC